MIFHFIIVQIIVFSNVHFPYIYFSPPRRIFIVMWLLQYVSWQVFHMCESKLGFADDFRKFFPNRSWYVPPSSLADWSKKSCLGICSFTVSFVRKPGVYFTCGCYLQNFDLTLHIVAIWSVLSTRNPVRYELEFSSSSISLHHNYCRTDIGTGNNARNQPRTQKL